MALSHACPWCGLELCRERSAPEPYYGLRIVRCPGCAAVGVRRPARTLGWRRGHRLRLMLRTLGVNLLALAVLGGFGSGLSLGFAGERTPLPDAAAGLAALIAGHPDSDSGAGTVLGALVLCSLLAGAWIASGLRHVPRWAALVGWACVLQAGATGPVLLDWAVDSTVEGRMPVRINYAEMTEYLRGASGAALLSAAVTAGGIPLGWGVTRVGESVSRAARRRRRSVLRRRRRAE